MAELRLCDSVVAMQFKVRLGPAWAEAEQMSDVDLASLFGVDLINPRSAYAGNSCPQCRNHPTDSHVQLFVYGPAVEATTVEGRLVVKCLCGTTYWYAFSHA